MSNLGELGSDPELEAIRLYAEAMNEEAVRRWLQDRGIISQELATEIVRNLVGPLRIAYLLDRAAEQPNRDLARRVKNLEERQ
jgi:hypothetical protein